MIHINSYAELEDYIKDQLKRQKEEKLIEIKLDKVWFFKLIKLIQFYLQYDKNEKDTKSRYSDNIMYFKVKINNRQTIIRQI